MATKLKKNNKIKKNKKTLKRCKIKITKGSGSVYIDKPHTTMISGMSIQSKLISTHYI